MLFDWSLAHIFVGRLFCLVQMVSSKSKLMCGTIICVHEVLQLPAG